MKTNVKLLIAIALMATACSTGSRVTSGGYSDDLYYTPGDAQPTAPRPIKEVKPPQQKSVVAMQVEENEQGKVVDNYIVPKSSRKDRNAYYFDDQPAYSDTILEYKDNKEQVTVNNYYEGEEMSYSSRIRAFYNPYFYDPFWDPYWSPYWSPYYGSAFSFGWGGYSPWSWGYGSGWYDPWYYGYGYGFGYGFGWGGYYPGWGGGYYPGWGWGGSYYSDWGGGGWNSGNYYAGMQNHTGKRGSSNAVRYGMNTNKSGSLSGSSAFGRSAIGRNPGSTSTRLSAGNNVNGVATGTRVGIGTGTNGSSTRLSSTRGNREVTTIQQNQVNGNTQSSRVGRGETISNLRRANSNNIQGSGVINQNGSSTRSSSAGRDYTPTYNRPRMNTQPSYNNGSSRQYSSPQSTYGTSQSNRYARPQSSVRGYSGAVRSQPSGSYQRGSVGNAATRSSGTISSESRSSSPRATQSSAPSRSYSAPSFSGGSSGGGNSGGGNSGGGGSRSSGRTR